MFGGDPMSGTFTPYIANCFKDTVHSCILDGEMVGYNPETKTIGRITGEMHIHFYVCAMCMLVCG